MPASAQVIPFPLGIHWGLKALRPLTLAWTNCTTNRAMQICKRRSSAMSRSSQVWGHLTEPVFDLYLACVEFGYVHEDNVNVESAAGLVI